MGSSRRDLRSGAHLCPFCRHGQWRSCRSTEVMPVNGGKTSQPSDPSTSFRRSPFRSIFDVLDMFVTSDSRDGISKVKGGD
ncbi:hypothetical protein TIFTF001_006520 [Ficus carica]|uniref:Uncharacterized protein n=1 Tax=Ficus carica TaxID=3494 RepID=A0AA88D0W2_FICCA|nr:hypothetical protein TIFTF001_006520 [Ficus carica]